VFRAVPVIASFSATDGHFFKSVLNAEHSRSLPIAAVEHLVFAAATGLSPFDVR
jgi:hypothetical protein